MRMILIAAAATLASPALADAVPRFSQERIRSDSARHCADLLPGRLSTQLFCRKEAAKGAAAFMAIADRYPNNPTMQQSLAHCLDLFTESGVINFGTLGFCAQTEEKAYLKLSR